METQKTKIGFPKKLVKTWFFLMLAATSIVACQKKGGDNNNQPVVLPYPVGVNPACTNCNINPGTLASAIGASLPAGMAAQFNFSLTFSGDSGAMQQQQSFYPASPLYNIYQGDLMISGLAQVTAGNIGNCMIPGGSYTISTVSMGVYNAGRIGSVYGSPMVLAATSGSFNFTFRIVNGGVYQAATRVYGDVIVQGQNGCMGQTYIN